MPAYLPYKKFYSPISILELFLENNFLRIFLVYLNRSQKKESAFYLMMILGYNGVEQSWCLHTAFIPAASATFSRSCNMNAKTIGQVVDKNFALPEKDTKFFPLFANDSWNSTSSNIISMVLLTDKNWQYLAITS